MSTCLILKLSDNDRAALALNEAGIKILDAAELSAL